VLHFHREQTHSTTPVAINGRAPPLVVFQGIYGPGLSSDPITISVLLDPGPILKEKETAATTAEPT